MEERRRYHRWSVFSLDIILELGKLNTSIAANTTYHAVHTTIDYICDRSEQPKPEVRDLGLAFPLKHDEIVAKFRAHIRDIKQSYSDATFTDVPEGALLPPGIEADPKGNRIVAVIDSIVSNPGVAMPWKELVQACKEEGVWSVIDAAHSIGQEVALINIVVQ